MPKHAVCWLSSDIKIFNFILGSNLQLNYNETQKSIGK